MLLNVIFVDVLHILDGMLCITGDDYVADIAVSNGAVLVDDRNATNGAVSSLDVSNRGRRR